MEVIIEPIKVMYTKSEGGPSGGEAAFHMLESKLPSIKGRKFYGTFQDGEYRACVEMKEADSPEPLGLGTWEIPGGKYYKRKVDDWSEKLEQIGSIFDQMAKEKQHDKSRPSIEFYRSQKELILFLPIL